MRGKLVNHRAAGIAEREHPRNFVVGFACSVVARASQAHIREEAGAIRGGGFHVIENRVPAGNDQAHGGQFRVASRRMRFHKHGMHVAFEVVHGDQRLAERERQHLAVRHADNQRAHKPRPLRHGNSVNVAKVNARRLDRFPYHGNDLAQMLARGKLGNYAAIFPMNVDLRGDHGR